MIDSIIKAVLSNDPEQVRPLIQFQTIPCTTAEGLGGPPKCAEGQAEGTEVTGFPVLGGEGGFVDETTIDGTLNSLKTGGLFGVYIVPTDPPAEPYYPKGRYALVFSPAEEGPPPFTIRATDEGIVRIDYNLGLTAAEAFDNNRGDGQIIIAPLE